MKVIMVMFDSLNRRFLSPYGCEWTHTPNFQRLAEKTLRFDTSYVCSMPCMPARRDLHTGRPNFLHRSWGPMEPYDESMPRILKENGVYTHLITDHYHYFEDGGSNYHTKYSSYEAFRGQEGDPWIGQVRDPEIPEDAEGRHGLKGYAPARQDWINRREMQEDDKQPQSGVFRAGLDFIDRNKGEDNWFLQIETFDPHEPFFSLPKYKELYYEPHYKNYNGPHFDWPNYERVQGRLDLAEHGRYEYASLVSMCDEKLGTLLDKMDAENLWEDTMLVVWTDHGFLLGEHDWWSKMMMPWWEETARTPFFVWDPRTGTRGESRESLVQPSIDLAPTLLSFFHQEIPASMTGHDLSPVIESDQPVRESAIFGQFGNQVNVTDGRYVYMRAQQERLGKISEYTLMPCHMRSPFGTDSFYKGRMSLAEPFDFMKDCQVMQIDCTGMGWSDESSWERDSETKQTVLYDLELDPNQESPIQDEEVESKMLALLASNMKACDAPRDQYVRLGLEPPIASH
ncbi:sulfatase [Puniceicoccus vermicola]|uniref:Sulfatase n=1 Tax=Puniceicoccus vermicola TaxID=388746 RepID=A0A7X1E2V6_9BACT|nr:sulfatase [Puniceicoccus vermicola]MBC2600411.1 sulfatase [Puniceicoccus vermicola]